MSADLGLSILKSHLFYTQKTSSQHYLLAFRIVRLVMAIREWLYDWLTDDHARLVPRPYKACLSATSHYELHDHRTHHQMLVIITDWTTVRSHSIWLMHGIDEHVVSGSWWIPAWCPGSYRIINRQYFWQTKNPQYEIFMINMYASSLHSH